MAGEYIVKWTDDQSGTNPLKPRFIIQPNTLNGPGHTDSDTPLELPGRFTPEYGEALSQSFVWLLENFSSPSEPVNPTSGMLWFDSANDTLLVRNAANDAWSEIGSSGGGGGGGALTLIFAPTSPTPSVSEWDQVANVANQFPGDVVIKVDYSAVLDDGWLLMPDGGQNIVGDRKITFTKGSPGYHYIEWDGTGCQLNGSSVEISVDDFYVYGSRAEPIIVVDPTYPLVDISFHNCYLLNEVSMVYVPGGVIDDIKNITVRFTGEKGYIGIWYEGFIKFGADATNNDEVLVILDQGCIMDGEGLVDTSLTSNFGVGVQLFVSHDAVGYDTNLTDDDNNPLLPDDVTLFDNDGFTHMVVGVGKIVYSNGPKLFTPSGSFTSLKADERFDNVTIKGKLVHDAPVAKAMAKVGTDMYVIATSAAVTLYSVDGEQLDQTSAVGGSISDITVMGGDKLVLLQRNSDAHLLSIYDLSGRTISSLQTGFTLSETGWSDRAVVTIDDSRVYVVHDDFYTTNNLVLVWGGSTWTEEAAFPRAQNAQPTKWVQNIDPTNRVIATLVSGNLTAWQYDPATPALTNIGSTPFLVTGTDELVADTTTANRVYIARASHHDIEYYDFDGASTWSAATHAGSIVSSNKLVVMDDTTFIQYLDNTTIAPTVPDATVLNMNPARVLFGKNLTASNAGSDVIVNAKLSSDVITESGTAVTLTASHIESYVRFTNASAVTVTVPTNANADIAIGTEIHLRAVTDGTVTIAGDVGVTVNAPASGGLVMAESGAAATIKKVAADEWDIMGQVSA